MEKFKTFRGTVCAVDRANIDTDALIPKEHLKSIKRTGFGPALFSDWRYNNDGSDNLNFSLNHPKAKNASILIGRNNFGCGSSREHAVWAVAQQGFKVVIAPRVGEIPGFADIFKNNCSKNGILAIELSSDDVDKIFNLSKKDEPLYATVNLEIQKLIFDEIEFSFEIDISVKDKLLSGMDDIAESLSHIKSIEQFETSHNTQFLK